MRFVRKRGNRLLLFTLLLLISLSVQAQDRGEPRLITVTGEAEVKVVPDEVVYDVTVQTFQKDLKTAKAQTDSRLKQVIELTRKYKIDSKDVQTDYIKLDPRYRGNDEARLLLGYSVRKDVVFTLRDVSQAESLLSELMESGISRINSVTFRTSESRKYRDQARAMAIRAAQEKATALTAQIGQKIGKAYSIEEEPRQRFGPPAGLLNVSQNSTTFAGDTDAESEGTTLSLGVISITARVTVKFELN
jgi:uncharacterized protein YggE